MALSDRLTTVFSRRLLAAADIDVGQTRPAMTLESPDDLNRLVGDVTSELEVLGLQSAARRFVGIQGAAFTTNSEWLGALGATVKEIRNECRLPPALDAKLDQIMTEVRRVWPRL